MTRFLLGLAVALLGVLSASERSEAQSWTRPPMVDYDQEGEDASPFWQEALGEQDAALRDLLRRAQEHLRGRRGQQRELALPLIEAALKLSPDSPAAHYELGNYYRLSNKWQECAQSFARVFEAEPGFVAERESNPWRLGERLGTCLLYSEQFEEAISHFQRLITQEHETAELQLRLGEGLMAVGRLREATFSLRRAQALAQSRSRTLLREVEFALAVALERGEHLRESRSLLMRLTNRDRQLTTLRATDKHYAPASDEHYYMGLAYLAMDNAPRGIYHFRRFLTLSPTSQWASHAKSNLRMHKVPKLAEQLHISGSAQWQEEPLRKAIRKSEDALTSCVEGQPDLLATITLSAVLTRPTAKHQARAAISAETQVSREALGPIVDCLESAARKIAVPKQTGLLGGHGSAQFVILGTAKH